MLILLLAASRALWALSCAGVLPKTFCQVGENRRTPWLAILLRKLFVSLFTSIRSIEQVAGLTNFITLLAFAGVNAAAFKLFKERGFGRSRVLSMLLPALGGAISLGLAANLGARAAQFGLIVIAAGTGIYWLVKYWHAAQTAPRANPLLLQGRRFACSRNALTRLAISPQVGWRR